MKSQFLFKTILLIAILFSIKLSSHAQGIYQLWGTTYNGGPDNCGVLFTTKSDGTGYQLKKNFTLTNPGKVDNFNKPEVFNNKFYCALTAGGLEDDGIIAEYNPTTNEWIKKVDFYSIGGKFDDGGLTLFNNKFYGVCHFGGLNNQGLLFEYNPITNTLTKLHDFDSISGSYPNEGLTIYNSKLYGVTKSGGTNDDGTVYEYNPATDIYTKKANFLASTFGNLIYGTKLVVYNNILWGTTNNGALGNLGAVFSFNPATNALVKKIDFHTIGCGTIWGSLTLLNNKLYGYTSNGGANGTGIIFEYNPATNLLMNKFDLSYVTGRHYMNFTVYNNILYSCSVMGGSNYIGQLFSFNPINNQYTALYNLQGSNGKHGAGAVTVYNNKLWGFTQLEAAYGRGTLFSYYLITNTFLTKINLGGSTLTSPNGALLYYNHKLYGICGLGGNYENNNGSGGIYEYDLAADTYNPKINFFDTIGNFFDQTGFTLLNDKFYTTASHGGNNNEGSLIEYNPAANTVTKKHDFELATGNKPYGGVSVYNGKLYGACQNGSSNGMGNIYEFNPITNVYAQKVILDNNKGSMPYSSLTWYNNKFYGTCFNGGANNGGTLFEYNPAINSFIKKVDFDSASGHRSTGALTAFNGKLYGMTMFGGINDIGTIFEFNPANSNYTKKVDFNTLSGSSPYSSLTLLNNKLFGMTPTHGSSNCGTLIQYDAATNIFTKKLDFTPSTGKTARSNKLVAVPALTAPGSTNSCINTQTININATNANQWIAFTDAQGRAVAEINANGNVLGNTAVRFYINGGNMRQDGNGIYYLDRSITVTPTTQPTTDVSIRLYIRKVEFDNLVATPGSGVNSPSDLNIVKNTDFCTSTILAATTPFTSASGNWATDYVYTSNVSSLGSFYFMGNVLPTATTLHVKLFIQAYYDGLGLMRPVLMNQGITANPNITDSIEVELHSAIFPSLVMASTKTILNSNGLSTCNFPYLNGSYYIVIKHRNGMQTWSSNPVAVGAIPVTYDFTISASQAYGSNQIEVEPGIWAFYSGDINQDENADLLDASLLEASIANFDFGYFATDINGDGNVDLLDSPMLEANVNGFIYSVHP
ncbi:MAG: hypothetical protein IPI46_00665 [Bacteroidetes bacterium]|nr:hypothetical protein [Bacteroidota bacterium]